MDEEHPLLRFLGELKNQWLIGAVVFFLLSLSMGAVEGGRYPFLYPALWVFFGLLFFFCMIKAFPDVWHLLLPVACMYVLSFIGVLAFARMDGFTDWLPLIAGLSAEGLGLWVVAITLFTVANRRDEMMEVRKYLGKGGKVGEDKQAVYVPLGFWALSVLMIFFLSNISIWYWSDYSTSGSIKSYLGYVASELILLALMVYFFWIPQNRLDYSFDKDIVTEVKRNPLVSFFQRFSLTRKKAPIAARLPSRKRVRRRRSVKCPDCGRKLILERRRCPGCSRIKRFGWCPGSEDYIVNCPNCRNLVALSPGKCRKCGQTISGTIECTCGRITDIDSWDIETG